MKTTLLLLATATTAACAASAPANDAIATPRPTQAPASENVAYVTRLGDDTIAIEQITRTEQGIRATVLLRSPQTTLRVYDFAFADPTMRIVRLDPATGAALGDTTVSVADGAGIPFIDMVHWPFQLMLERTIAASTDTITLPLVSGNRTVAFRMERLADGSFAATHPTRGTMTITASQARLVSLDASRTTRALHVTASSDDVDIMTLARSFAGRPMGELSGRGEVAVNVAGADIAVDYGVPQKRGREIFGALVPWERVWRTGANRATHFSTSRPLRVGDDVIPAGTYTLFTIPRPDRWTLIVNRNVDINGQQYDAAADLVHLDLAVRRLDQVVEPFTIVVEPDGPSGGILRLRWDTTEAWLPFVVE